MKRLWISFALVIVVSFTVLGWIGARIYQEAPPIAATVLTTDGAILIEDGDIGAGQNVWQALGGMEVGSIWGHGSYVAPDWTADWLHREALFILNRWAQTEFGADFEQLEGERQALLTSRVSTLMRTNTGRSHNQHPHRRSHSRRTPCASNLAHCLTTVFAETGARSLTMRIPRRRGRSGPEIAGGGRARRVLLLDIRWARTLHAESGLDDRHHVHQQLAVLIAQLVGNRATA